MVAEEQARRDEELVVRRGTRRGQDLEGRSRSRAFFSIHLQLGGDQGRVTRQETLTGAWFCLADGQGSCGCGQSRVGERPWKSGLDSLGSRPEGP